MSTLITSPLVKKLLNTSRKAVSMEPMPRYIGQGRWKRTTSGLVSSWYRQTQPGESPMNRMHSHGGVNSKNSLRACRARMRSGPCRPAAGGFSVPRVSSCSSHFSRRVATVLFLAKPMAQRASRTTSGGHRFSTSATMTSATTAVGGGQIVHHAGGVGGEPTVLQQEHHSGIEQNGGLVESHIAGSSVAHDGGPAGRSGRDNRTPWHSPGTRPTTLPKMPTKAASSRAAAGEARQAGQRMMSQQTIPSSGGMSGRWPAPAAPGRAGPARSRSRPSGCCEDETTGARRSTSERIAFCGRAAGG